MLVSTVDARISRALARLRQARDQGHPCVIAHRERQLDSLLELRLAMTDWTPEDSDMGTTIVAKRP